MRRVQTALPATLAEAVASHFLASVQHAQLFGPDLYGHRLTE
jgi:hypothetical protein